MKPCRRIPSLFHVVCALNAASLLATSTGLSAAPERLVGLASLISETNAVPLEEALGTTNLSWWTGGDAPWFGQLAIGHDAHGAAQAGSLEPGQSSRLRVSVEGPATLSFWWQTGSGSILNYLALGIDGVEQNRLFGVVSWQPQTFFLAAGSHELSWVYSKGEVDPTGSDAAWLDEVTVTPGFTVPYLRAEVSEQTPWIGQTLRLEVDAIGTPPLAYQWRREGTNSPGATNASLTLSNMARADSGSYEILVSNPFSSMTNAFPVTVVPVAVWGDNSVGQLRVPASASNAVAIAAGRDHCLALRPDGMIVGWGSNSFGQATIPPEATNIIAISAGREHSLALKADGTMLVWGANNYSQTNMPAGLTNLVAIAAAYFHNLGLTADSRVVAFGQNSGGQSSVPADLEHVVEVAGGYNHSLALMPNGTVRSWGSVFDPNRSYPAFISGLTRILAVEAGAESSFALRDDGTVSGYSGLPTYPYDFTRATNKAAISASSYHLLALGFEGRVTGYGLDSYGQIQVPEGLNHVVAVAAGRNHSMALIGEGVPAITCPPRHQWIGRGDPVQWRVFAVGAAPLAYQWRYQGVDLPGATNAVFALTNVQPADAGAYSVQVSNALGTALSHQAILTLVTSPAEAMNALYLSWQTFGNQPWLVDTNTSHDGWAAARSGPLTHGQFATLATTVTGPGTLRFWWKVSSETNVDVFRFSMLSPPTDLRISGEVDWRQEIVRLSNAAPYAPRWIYTKSPSGSAGRDAAWLDEVVFSPDGQSAVLYGQPHSQWILSGKPAWFTVTAGGEEPLRYQWWRDGAALPDATNAWLRLPSVTPQDAGAYWVTVSNALGHAESTHAWLEVHAPYLLLPPVPQADGTWVLRFGNQDHHPVNPADAEIFALWGSPNLVDWQRVPGVVTASNGLFMVHGISGTNTPTRFYRVIEK